MGRAGGQFQLTEVAVDDDYSPHHSDVYEDDYDIHYESGREYIVWCILPSPPVLRIRIHRIHMIFGLPDPDPLVRGMDPDPDPSIIMKKVRKTLIPTILRLFLTFYL